MITSRRRGRRDEVSPAGSVGAGRCPPGTSAPAFPYSKKGETDVPSWGGTEAGGLACGKGGLGASTPAPGAIACVLACRLGQR